MTIKTAAWVALSLVGAAFLFSYVYLSYVDTGTLVATDPALPPFPPTSQEAMMPQSKVSQPPKAPATPDTAVNDLIDEALADRDDLDAEVKGELSDIETDTTNINNLNEVYADQEIQ